MTYQIIETIANGDTDKATYQIVDEANTPVGDSSPHFSLVVDAYCRLTGEDSDMIDSAHETVYVQTQLKHEATDMPININAAPCYNVHKGRWNVAIDLPEGPITIFQPMEGGTEDMDSSAEFVVEFRGEYPDMMAAIHDIRGEMGRFMWSRPNLNGFLGFLNHCPGSVAMIAY